MAGRIIDAARDRFRENRPLAAAVVEGLRNAASNPDNALTARDVPAVAEAVEDAIARDPLVRNATNQEPLRNSRTFMGNVIAFVSWLLLVLQFLNGDRSGAENIILNAPEILAMIGAVSGHAIGAVGRTVRNLPPIDWRRPWTALGLGR